MRQLPNNPHAIIEVQRSGFGDGQSQVIWDSWESKRLFKSVYVDLVTNELSQVQFSFFDERFRVIDAFAGSSGVAMDTVRVYLGFGSNLGEPVFKGLLAHVERGQSDTTFTAFDMGFKLKLVKKAGYKNKKDDIAIIRELAKRNGLQFEGPENPLKLEPHRAMMQDEQTDWEHAMERAQDSGLVLFVREDTLFAKYPAKKGTPIARFQNRKDFQILSDFDLIFRTPESQDGRPRVVKRRARGKGGKRIEGQSDVSNRGRESVVLKRDVPGKATKSKLTKRAQAQKELEREHAFECTIGAIPFERIDVRKTVEITDVGKLFSGEYLTDAVRYEFEPGRLLMNLDLYRDINA